MKYSELHRKLKEIGCYETGRDRGGHPEWYSPKTGETFKTGRHLKKELATGTLAIIKKLSGLK